MSNQEESSLVKLEEHYTIRTGWLRAAVLGANDGILSTTSLVIGVAAASSDGRSVIILTALAGLVSGAMSMAAGEYVSVSSQADVEKADLEREKHELKTMPEAELNELCDVYKKRGLDHDLAMEVAIKLTQHNALEAHARDELGINEMTRPRPFQASMASGASFIVGGLLPLLMSIFAPLKYMVEIQYVFAILFLALSGTVAARLGGSNVLKSVLRICFWGTFAMAMAALVGYIFGINVG